MRSVPVAETAWTLVVNGARIGRGTASPGQGRELVAGLLLAEGFIATPADLVHVEERQGRLSTTLDARVPADRFEAAIAERSHREENGCGLLHFVACDPSLLARERSLGLPGDDAMASHLRRLFDVCSRAHPGGGVHAAAVAGPAAAAWDAVDVSRHAAVEKAIGAAFLNGLEAGASGLVLTARMSGRIALTAARAGLSWIASRSIPTTMAVRIAAVAGLTLVARAGSRDVHRFAPTGTNGEG